MPNSTDDRGGSERARHRCETIANGEVAIAIKGMRLASEDFPSLAKFSSKIVLHGEAITFRIRGARPAEFFGLDGT